MVTCHLSGSEDDQLHPEIFSYKISSGHELYGMLFKPTDMVPGKKYPTVLVIYGGPEVQLISNTYKGLRYDLLVYSSIVFIFILFTLGLGIILRSLNLRDALLHSLF